MALRPQRHLCQTILICIQQHNFNTSTNPIHQCLVISHACVDEGHFFASVVQRDIQCPYCHRAADRRRLGKAGQVTVVGRAVAVHGLRCVLRIGHRSHSGSVKHEALLQRHRASLWQQGVDQGGAVGLVHVEFDFFFRAHWANEMRPLMPAMSSAGRPSMTATTLMDWLTGSTRAPKRATRAL